MRTEMAAALKVDEQPAAIEAPTGRIPVATVQLMQPAAAGLLTVGSAEEDDGLIGPKQKPTMTLARAPWRPAQLAALDGIRTAVRGLRAVTDFEHEFAMALTNRSLWPEFDTVFLMTKAEYMYLSSSVVRQVSQMGGQVDQFVPKCVERRLRQKFGHA